MSKKIELLACETCFSQNLDNGGWKSEPDLLRYTVEKGRECEMGCGYTATKLQSFYPVTVKKA